MSSPAWEQVKEYEDITYHKCDGVARIGLHGVDQVHDLEGDAFERGPCQVRRSRIPRQPVN